MTDDEIKESSEEEEDESEDQTSSDGGSSGTSDEDEKDDPFKDPDRNQSSLEEGVAHSGDPTLEIEAHEAAKENQEDDKDQHDTEHDINQERELPGHEPKIQDKEEEVSVETEQHRNRPTIDASKGVFDGITEALLTPEHAEEGQKPEGLLGDLANSLKGIVHADSDNLTAPRAVKADGFEPDRGTLPPHTDEKKDS